MRRRADVVFINVRLAVFVDGCFWHGCPTHGTWPKANAAWWKAKIEANRRRDADTDDRLRAKGWFVLRFWAHEDPINAARHIATFIEGRRALGRKA
jgi:DNA mismatch endonuclease (patch repair protein)